ncbi:MAG: hypothetical protein IRY85_10300 [Micromonosporaceae bacterium]|nr:hypothetical protein [Micromonosporaceae bacterium]
MPHRLVAAAIAIVCALVGVVGLTGTPAAAEPEGGTAEMRRQLDEAQRGYLDAKAALDASVARQQELTVTLESVEAQLDVEAGVVGRIARNAYMSAGFTGLTGVMAAGSTERFLAGMSLLDVLATREGNAVRHLLDTRANAQAAQDAIEAELAIQSELLAEMENRKQQAQQALWSVGGGQPVNGFSAAASVVAEPAPRNADGGWSPEVRSIYEPATGGSITPRTAHAVAQAQAAGFNRYVACYRSLEDGGEHPRGRACDFAVNPGSGYGGDAYGEARDYGNNLAAFFVFNSERLGVLYVIWYQQIWMASSNRWYSYSGCCDPSSKHTNHVHLSMY